MKTIRTVLFLIFCACISGAQTHTGGGFTPGGSAAAGGSNTQGQYNNNGVLGGSAGLTLSSTQVTGMTTTCQPGEALVAGASGVNACSAVPNGTTPPTTTTNIGTANLAITVPNEAVTGTALNKLAKLTGSPLTAITIGTSDTTNAVGIVVSGNGTTGNATISQLGTSSCFFDNTTVVGHYVVASTTSAGKCHDSGSSSVYPSGVQVFGLVAAAGDTSAARAVILTSADISASGSAGGKGTAIQIAGTNSANTANFNATTPAAPAGGTNVTFQVSTSGNTSSVSGYVFIPLSCQPGLGDGLNAITAGTYLQSTCYNDTGATWTITGIKCFTDNSGSSTMNVTNNSGTGLLTGAVTCSSSFAPGTQSGTTTLAAGGYLKFTFVADGTSKQTSWVVTATR